MAAAVDDDEHCNATFPPGADYLLRKLRYSNIRTGIVYELGLSAEKVHLLESTAKLHSFYCFSMNVTSIEDTVNEIALAWRESGGRFLLVVSNCNADLSVNLGSHGWLIVVLDTGGEVISENSSMLYIEKLEELPLTICNLNRKTASRQWVLTV